MDVNQVRFGNYSIGNSRANTKRNNSENQPELITNNNTQNTQTLTPDKIFNAMDIQGKQNAAQINFASALNIPDVNKYLSNERIAEIEAMMKEFDNGVNAVANVITQEFKGVFSEAQTNALAAQVFAKE